MKKTPRKYFGLNLDDKRVATSLRFVGYGFMLLAASLIAFILVASANGFDIDRETGQVIQNGLVLVDSQPESAQIFVDGQSENDDTPGRLPLPEGQHDILLTREGYDDWSKTVNLEGSEVIWLYYPRLFPTQLDGTIVQSFNSLKFAEQSPDERWLFMSQNPARNSFSIIDLENPLDNPATVSVPNNLIPQSDNPGTFDFVEWAGSNRHVMLKYSFDNEVNFFLLDRERPAQSLNITETVGLDITEPHFRGNRSDIIYAMVGQTVREINLDNGSVSAPVLREVVYYQVNGDDKLLFVQKISSENDTIAGIWKDGNVRLLQRLDANSTSYFLSYDAYDDNEYFAVSSNLSRQTFVFANPLDVDETVTQIPSNTLELNRNVRSSGFSDNKQFLLTQAGDQFTVYDFEEQTTYSFELSADIRPSQVANWIDGHRLLIEDRNGDLTVVEYDGQNIRNLVNSPTALSPKFDRSFENMYVFGQAGNNKTTFQQYSLIAE